MRKIDWPKLVGHLPNCLSGPGASLSRIAEYEKMLGVKFEDAYVECLQSIGFLLCDGFKINGVCDPDHMFYTELDVVQTTGFLRGIYGDDLPPASYFVGSEFLALSSHRILSWPAEIGYFDFGYAGFLEWFDSQMEGRLDLDDFLL